MLKSCLNSLKHMLSDPTAERDFAWAYETCRLSREIHLSVWELAPKKAFVRKEIIPALLGAREALETVIKSAALEDAVAVSAIKENIGTRVANLERYIAGESPAIEPSSVLVRIPRREDLRNRLQSKLIGMSHGKESCERYEVLIGDIIKKCFCGVFTNLERQRVEVDGCVRRDWIAGNSADRGFWAMVRHRYAATQVIWECKNELQLRPDDFHQLAYYMVQATGRFAVLSYRGEKRPHYYRHIKRISQSIDGMVLILNDEDLHAILEDVSSGGSPDGVLQRTYDQSVRAIS